jgi:hypothetical protein
MPIRAENRKYYDAGWRKFRLIMLAAAGNVWQRLRQATPALNVAHLPHDPTHQHLLTAVPQLPRQERYSTAHRYDAARNGPGSCGSARRSPRSRPRPHRGRR